MGEVPIPVPLSVGMSVLSIHSGRKLALGARLGTAEVPVPCSLLMRSVVIIFVAFFTLGRSW